LGCFGTFALEYSIKKVQANQECLKLNVTHQFLVYADYVIMLGGSTRTLNKNTEALAVASKQTVLEVSAEKMKYMIMSRDQPAGQNCILKIGNKSFDRLVHFRYLGTNPTYRNSRHAEIKSRWKSRNGFYHSVHKLFSYSVLSKNIKINYNLTRCFYRYESWPLTLREELRLRVFKNGVLRRIFGPKIDEVTGKWRKLHNEELNYLFFLPSVVRVIKLRRMVWAEHVARMG
jgi:shikimate kinase